MKRSTCLFLLLLAFFIPSLASAQSDSTKSKGLVASNYTLHPLDVIQVMVFKEPDLEQQVRVSQDGTINLSLIGKVNVAGMTVSDANVLVTDLYNRDYLVNPQISMLLISYTERRAYVHGQVNRPGPVIIPPEETMTLSQVISAAGSTTRLASDTIRVTRTDKDGKKNVMRFDFSDIMKDPEANDIIILDGDNIFIDERII